MTTRAEPLDPKIAAEMLAQQPKSEGPVDPRWAAAKAQFERDMASRAASASNLSDDADVLAAHKALVSMAEVGPAVVSTSTEKVEEKPIRPLPPPQPVPSEQKKEAPAKKRSTTFGLSNDLIDEVLRDFGNVRAPTAPTTQVIKSEFIAADKTVKTLSCEVCKPSSDHAIWAGGHMTEIVQKAKEGHDEAALLVSNDLARQDTYQMALLSACTVAIQGRDAKSIMTDDREKANNLTPSAPTVATRLFDFYRELDYNVVMGLLYEFSKLSWEAKENPTQET